MGKQKICCKQSLSESLTQTCKETIDCSGSLQSAICLEGKCVCKPGYTRDGQACWITSKFPCFINLGTIFIFLCYNIQLQYSNHATIIPTVSPLEVNASVVNVPADLIIFEVVVYASH